MIEFQHILLENFKSFSGLHDFGFKNRLPGLYFITGINKQQPKLETNGVGKSTLWDSLCWCLYGKTLRSVKASNVKTWWAESNDACKVALSFKKDKQTYTIVRMWNPNQLLINGKTVEQDNINQLIGLSFDSFQHCVIMGQFSKMFFDLGPGAKLELMTSVLDLDFWLERSSKARVLKIEADTKIHQYHIEFGEIKGKISVIREIISTRKKQAEEADKKIEKQISLISREIKKCKRDTKEDKRAKKKAQKYLDNHLKKATKIQEELDPLLQLIDTMYDQLTEIKIEIGKAEQKRDTIKESISNFKEIGAICGICHQKVTKKHKKEHLQILVDDRKRVSKELKALHKKHDVQKQERDDYVSITKELLGDIKKLNEIMDPITDKIVKYARKIEATRGAILTLTKNQEGVANSNTFLEGINFHISKLNLYKLEKKEIAKNIKNLKRDITSYSFWSKGFKNLRLVIIEEALQQLEIEVNNNLMLLGLEDWSIGFDIERETASGGISKGFAVNILSPDTKKPVPWECWSGGEGGRLKLAGTLGLSSLIRQMLGIDFNIEVFDEPMEYISPIGVQDTLDVLHNRAMNNNHQIWLVDHISLSYNNFQTVVHIDKTAEGSIIRQ